MRHIVEPSAKTRSSIVTVPNAKNRLRLMAVEESCGCVCFVLRLRPSMRASAPPTSDGSGRPTAVRGARRRLSAAFRRAWRVRAGAAERRKRLLRRRIDLRGWRRRPRRRYADADEPREVRRIVGRSGAFVDAGERYQLAQGNIGDDRLVVVEVTRKEADDDEPPVQRQRSAGGPN